MLSRPVFQWQHGAATTIEENAIYLSCLGERGTADHNDSILVAHEHDHAFSVLRRLLRSRSELSISACTLVTCGCSV